MNIDPEIYSMVSKTEHGLHLPPLLRPGRYSTRFHGSNTICRVGCVRGTAQATRPVTSRLMMWRVVAVLTATHCLTDTVWLGFERRHLRASIGWMLTFLMRLVPCPYHTRALERRAVEPFWAWHLQLSNRGPIITRALM